MPNGDNLEDMCGTCDDDGSNDCVQDCAGEWGGSAENDECGVCEGDNSTCNQPVANNSTFRGEEDEVLGFLISASDPNGDDLEVTVLSGPSNGSLTFYGLAGAYDPDYNFNGIDEFTFTVTDGEWTSNEATITIDLVAVNDIPLAFGFEMDASTSSGEDECVSWSGNQYMSSSTSGPIYLSETVSVDYGSATMRAATSAAVSYTHLRAHETAS